MKLTNVSQFHLSTNLPNDRNLAAKLAIVIALLTAGCSDSKKIQTSPELTANTAEASEPRVNIRFQDVAKSGGVSWIQRNGEEAGLYSLLESLGAGCAIDDFDGDEDLDILFAGGGQFGSAQEIQSLPLGLFRQTSEWRFVQNTNEAGLEPVRHFHHGVWTVDHDEDGFSDVLITGYGGLQFFHNEGDGTFTDVTELSGLTDTMWSVAAAWADINQDQILDLFVGHYLDWSINNPLVCKDRYRDHRSICDPTFFNGVACTAYLGQGDGTYRDAGRELGIDKIGKTLGVVITDLNGDRKPDIYVANDTLPNQLYESLPAGGYHEVAISSGVALGNSGTPDGSMGVDAGDIDGDGRVDLFVANYEKQSFSFYRNLSPELFTHASLAFGVNAVGAEAVGFGTVIFDADGDSRLDIFCANGHIYPPILPVERRQRPYLFWNDGQRLLNVAGQAGAYMQQRHLGRGVACGDFDSNGTPDLVVTHTNEPVALLKNETSIPNWLSVRLVGRDSPRSAIGTQVIVVSGQEKQVGLIKGGGSYLSTSDRTLLFGLGSQKSVQSVEVYWPSGAVTMKRNVAPNQRLLLIEEIRVH